MITFDDTDITHVKYFRPQEAGKRGKQRNDNAVREEGFYGINATSPGKIVGLSYDWVPNIAVLPLQRTSRRNTSRGGSQKYLQATPRQIKTRHLFQPQFRLGWG